MHVMAYRRMYLLLHCWNLSFSSASVLHWERSRERRGQTEQGQASVRRREPGQEHKVEESMIRGEGIGMGVGMGLGSIPRIGKVNTLSAFGGVEMSFSLAEGVRRWQYCPHPQWAPSYIAAIAHGNSLAKKIGVWSQGTQNHSQPAILIPSSLFPALPG